jgi:hypothetical protein
MTGETPSATGGECTSAEIDGIMHHWVTRRQDPESDRRVLNYATFATCDAAPGSRCRGRRDPGLVAAAPQIGTVGPLL